MSIVKISSIFDVEKCAWNDLVPKNFPFAYWEHLASLERSNSVGSDSGWIPQYLLLYEKNKLVGATYLYEKNHSYGEYIFDWEWATWAEQLRLPYYPKTVSAIPFTPATGSKLLVHPQKPTEPIRDQLVKAAIESAKEKGSSGVHFLFISKDEIDSFKRCGFSTRDTFQFHWQNNNYGEFSDFLSELKQKKSKEIKRERQQVIDSGIKIEILSGDQLNKELADFLYFFYLRTIEKKQSFAYLNQKYFYQVFERLNENIRLFVASDDKRPLACSLVYHGAEKLYGRYWGALKDVRGLHFELCYYRPIEYAIDNGIQTFEAGAQGPHKIQRGFLPAKTYSAHLCFNDSFNQLISKFISHEKKSLDHGLAEFFKNSPFRNS